MRNNRYSISKWRSDNRHNHYCVQCGPSRNKRWAYGMADSGQCEFCLLPWSCRDTGGSNNKLESAAVTYVLETATMTPCETVVLERLYGKQSLKEIAWDLHISMFTVRFHARNIYRKLGVQGRTDLLAKEIERLRERQI